MASRRIEALDGFRAIAVLGVLWAHVWMFVGNPSFTLFKLNIASAISFFGTGVDLFFVISGFCMYLMYLSKTETFSWSYYFSYLKKRWLRIAPAFYVAAFVYGMVEVNFILSNFNWEYWLKLTLFIRNFFEEKTPYGPHFWSLGTEWHFYLILPFVTFFLARSFKVSMTVILGVGLLLRLIFWIDPNTTNSILNYSIANRLVEFMMGVIAARIYLSDDKAWYTRSIAGTIIGIFVALIGRAFMSADFHNRMDVFGVLSRTLDLPLLSMGYAMVVVNSLNLKSIWRTFLETKFMTWVGKYSYSMYLWHWMVSFIVVSTISDSLAVEGFYKVNILFIVSLIILVPVSFISYKLFEQFYFKKK